MIENPLECERCHAPAHIVAVATDEATGAELRRVVLCETCASTTVPRRVEPAEIAALLALEASGREPPAGFFAMVAEDVQRSLTYHGDPVPAEMQAFIARHLPAAP